MNPVNASQPMLDHELLQRYAREQCQRSFGQLVARHGQLVFATAFRKLGDIGLAEEVTQNVLTALAMKASKLHNCTSIAGWLYRATRLEAVMIQRRECRRRRRETRAAELAELRAQPFDLSDTIGAALDEALDELSNPDRAAIFGRFYDELTIGELAEATGISKKAAQKRVERALQRLRRCLLAAGVTLPMRGLRAQLVSSDHVLAAGRLASLSRRSLSAVSTAGPGLLSFSTMGYSAAICGTAVAVLVAWTFARAPRPSDPVSNSTHVVSLAGSKEHMIRVDDLEAIYRLPNVEREVALDRLMTYLKTRYELPYLRHLFDRWSRLDPGMSVISAMELGETQDYLFSVVIPEALRSWLKHDSGRAMAWIEAYDRGRECYESDLGDTVFETAIAWLVEDDFERAATWLMDRRVITAKGFDLIAERMITGGYEEAIALLDEVPEDPSRRVVFAIEHDVGEVNLGDLLPAARGEREVPGDGTIVYEFSEGARKGFLSEIVLRRFLTSAPRDRLADRALPLYHPGRHGNLIETVLKNWMERDADAALGWFQETRDQIILESRPLNEDSHGSHERSLMQAMVKSILAAMPSNDLDSVWQLWTSQEVHDPFLMDDMIADSLSKSDLWRAMLEATMHLENPAWRARGFRLCGRAIRQLSDGFDSSAAMVNKLKLDEMDHAALVGAMALANEESGNNF